MTTRIDNFQNAIKSFYMWMRRRPPLVSVVITCYNHGRFLPDAIDSVFSQHWELSGSFAPQWSPFEILVVDDGSTDDTRAVAKRYPRVRYIYQSNQGLSAARNTGIKKSKGDFLVFLDADDWLYSNALFVGLEFMQSHPEVAFVSGKFDKVDIDKNLISAEGKDFAQDYYLRLLEGNYIAMHATVMYRRELFDTFAFDTSLNACEDYDMYLKIARVKPIAHHTHRIAAYRQHGKNMSGNIPMMLSAALQVLARQQPGLRNEAERQAYDRGVKFWTEYYEGEMNRQAGLGK